MQLNYGLLKTRVSQNLNIPRHRAGIDKYLHSISVLKQFIMRDREALSLTVVRLILVLFSSLCFLGLPEPHSELSKQDGSCGAEPLRSLLGQ